jgi:hypothetical protein
MYKLMRRTTPQKKVDLTHSQEEDEATLSKDPPTETKTSKEEEGFSTETFSKKEDLHRQAPNGGHTHG